MRIVDIFTPGFTAALPGQAIFIDIASPFFRLKIGRVGITAAGKEQQQEYRAKNDSALLFHNRFPCLILLSQISNNQLFWTSSGLSLEDLFIEADQAMISQAVVAGPAKQLVKILN